MVPAACGTRFSTASGMVLPWLLRLAKPISCRSNTRFSAKVRLAAAYALGEVGAPAKVVRKLRPEELRMLKASERSYRALAKA